MLSFSVLPPVLFLVTFGEVFNDDDSSELPPLRRPGEVFGTKAGADVEPSPLRERRLPVVEVLDICGRAVPILILDSGMALFEERDERSFLFFSAGFGLKDEEDNDDCPEPKERLGGFDTGVGKLLPFGCGIALRLTSDLEDGNTT